MRSTWIPRSPTAPTSTALTSFTDARGNGIQYGYDSHGNLTSATYADGSKETYTYDAHGDVLTATNRRGQTVSYTYNAAGEVLTKDYDTTPGVVDFRLHLRCRRQPDLCHRRVGHDHDDLRRRRPNA